MTARYVLRSFLGLGVCLTLAACQTTGSTSAGPSASDNAARIDAALERAANAAAASGERRQSHSYLESIYKRNPSDPKAAIDYAAALREADYLTQASMVLLPFADDPKSPAAAKTEFAAVQLALGNNDAAENYAKKAVLQDNDDAKAYHYLGIALDAKGMHREAERAFRRGLDNWSGDPTSIMNNLALNLTTQGYFEEAVEILQKAKVISPDRIEIERNLRIVNTLMESERGTALHATPRRSGS